MRQRTNPWPSFADLFSATLIATFAGMVLMTTAYEQELKGYKERQGRVEAARDEADRMIQQVKQALEKDKLMQPITRKCGDDTCIDLFIHFSENFAIITDETEREALKTTCKTLKDALDGLEPERRKDIEIIIEGHTDNKQPKRLTDPREKYLYNWNLSAGRATSVSYEFQQCGLDPANYRIVAIGYADSEPQCSDDSDLCSDKNRRTTLRLRGDTKGIEERLKKQVSGAR
jgi:flagellar motor protein MotB